MKVTAVAAGLVAATVAQECCLSTTVQDAFPLFCDADSEYTQGSHCEAGTTCCDLFEIPDDAGGFDCCPASFSCHACENEDHCDLLAGQKNFCALDLTCVVGQGQKNAADLETAANSLEGCQALCEASQECQAFDYTLSAKSDACRLYYGFYDNVRIGDAGRDDRMYCEYPPPPASAAGDYDCEEGQGERGEAIASGNFNSEEECEAACDANDMCEAFDYTTKSQGDSCRLYGAGQTPRLGNGGGDDRMYCERHGGPTETTETEDGDHQYDCAEGQGERGEAISVGNRNSAEECEAACDANDMCEAFDYTTKSQSDSCRLYSANQTPRLGDGGSDNRMYCEHDDGPDETETTEDGDDHYDCAEGQGEKGESISSGNSNSEEECAAACDASAMCEAFDFTTKSQSDSCRLYNADQTPRSDGGSDDRRYCVRHDGPEETEPTAADEPTAAGDQAFFCQAGQGERGQSFSESNSNSYNACLAQCEISTGCVAFDYTTDSKSDACRLYEANEARSDAGRNNRVYCSLVANVRNIPLYFEGITGR